MALQRLSIIFAVASATAATAKFAPQSKEDLKKAVDACIAQSNGHEGIYPECEDGPMNSWDVSAVTDMSYLFDNQEHFKADISKWDVSNVTNMQLMFSGCHEFNGDLSEWNVDRVKKMHQMFRDAHAFNQDLSEWDVSNVES